jgi:hypothetical protein
MNQLTSLFFPDTVLAPTSTAQALLFFEKVYHYLPTEQSHAEDVETQALYDEALCEGYAPAPLGDEIEKFNRVIKDMKSNLMDYGERIRHLSLASLTARNIAESDERSVDSISAAILAKKRPTEEPDPLWNARIVLKLAETLDAEENEITTNLKKLDRHEKEMFSLLQGAEKEDINQKFPFIDHHDSPPAPSQTMLRKLQAWARLFLADHAKNRPLETSILSSDRGEIINFLLEKYTDLRGCEPALLLSIPLPALEGYSSSDFIQKRNAFRKKAAPLLKKLQEFVIGSSTTPSTKGTSGTAADLIGFETIETWTRTVTNLFPAQYSDRGKLFIYKMEGVSCDELFARVLLKDFSPTRRFQNSPSGLLAHICL